MNDDDRPQGEYNTVKSVETSIAIVETLCDRQGVGVTELADVVESSKSNIYKHLQTLRKQGFVVKDEQKYRLSLRFLDLGGGVREEYATSQHIKPKIAELAEQTEEVAQFMVENRGYSVVVYKETGQKGVSMRTRIGTHIPINQVASGKAMLATMPQEKVIEIIDRRGLPAATERTITSRGQLMEELEEINERGYAINSRESTEGLDAVSVPVEGPAGFIGACTVSGPSFRIQERIANENLPDILLSIANEIELNITHA